MAKFPSTLLPQSNKPEEGQRAILDLLSKINEIVEANFRPGMIVEYAGAEAPSGGWLMCDGSAVSRTKYAELFKVIGTNFGAGDGSKTFNVPDKREAYGVGVGTRASGVTAHDAFTLGEFKDDQFQGHWHNFLYAVGTRTAGTNNTYAVNGAIRQSGAVFDPITDTVNGTPRTGTVTRGKGLGLNYIIKT
jgi:microcystin-dependent protein